MIGKICIVLLGVYLLYIFASFLFFFLFDEDDRHITNLVFSEPIIYFDSQSQSTHLDIVFTLDTTGSMSSYIEQTKKIIIATIKKYAERSQDVKFGIVAYRDFPPEESSYITKIHGLSNDKDALDFLSKLDANGGGDAPEAVLTGLYDTITTIQWRNLENDNQTKYKKVIIHAGDQPPHGSIYSSSSNWPEGEPNGVNAEKVAEMMNKENIFYAFCKLTDSTNKMEAIFKKLFVNFSILDNSLKPENAAKDEAAYEKYRSSYGSYSGSGYSYGSYSRKEKEAVVYESKVSNYMNEL